MGDRLLRLVCRPSGADSPICLIPRLTPWAMILRLSEAKSPWCIIWFCKKQVLMPKQSLGVILSDVKGLGNL